MRDMNEDLNNAMMQALIEARDLMESQSKETLRIDDARHAERREENVYRARIRLGKGDSYIGIRVPFGNLGMRNGYEVEVFCTPYPGKYEFRQMNMTGIDPHNAREVLEKFSETIMEEITDFIRENKEAEGA